MKEDAGRLEIRLWNELVEQYHARIFGFCWQILGSRHEAEDAAQDCFYKAYKARRTLQAGGSVKSWLYAIARNACLDRKRWWRRWRIQLDWDSPSEGFANDSALFVELRQMIAALPARQKEVFVLRHWHGFSTVETAALLGTSEGTVKSHLSRAVAKLKQEISAGGGAKELALSDDGRPNDGRRAR